MHVSKRRLWPQILVSLVLTCLATGLVLRLTWQERSWRELQSFDTRWLLVALGLMLAAWLADAWRLQAMGRGMGYRVPLLVALRTNLLGYFLSAITPFTIGGGPLQVYSLYRAGLPVGHAAAAVVGSGFIAHLSLALLGLLLVFGLGLTVSADPVVDGVVRWALLIYTAGLFALTVLLWQVHRARRVIGRIASSVLRLFGKPERAQARAAAVDAAVVELSHGLRQVVGRWGGWVLAGAAAYQLYFILLFSTVPALAKGLGSNPPYWHVVAVQVPIYLLGSIIPTPGASGGLELGMAAGLLDHVPEYEIGIIVAAWRLLTYHVTLLVGGAVLVWFVRGVGRVARSDAGSAQIDFGPGGFETLTGGGTVTLAVGESEMLPADGVETPAMCNGSAASARPKSPTEPPGPLAGSSPDPSIPA